MDNFRVEVKGLDPIEHLFAGIEGKIGDAINEELSYTTQKAHQEVTSSHDPPFKTGFTRKSTGVEPGKSIFSTLPWARIWEFGGPSAVAPGYTFPKTEWLSKPMDKAFDDFEDRLQRRINKILN